MKKRPAVIALVPTRDEAGTLSRFLGAALAWADAVVVCDQHSVDRTVEVARSFPGATVIANQDHEFGEESRQQLLIAEARRLAPGPRFLVALDADELLSANVLTSEAWEAAVRSPPGTCVRIGRVELCEAPSQYFIDWGEDRGRYGTFAYADDGRPHSSRRFHANRLPEPHGAPEVVLEEIVVLHFALGNPAKVASKDRWYQCFERLHNPEFDVVAIRRRYDWLKRLAPTFDIRPAPDEWFAAYRERGVDLSEREGPDVFWTDWEVLRMFATHGVAPFAHLDIWSVDWDALRLRGRAAGISGLPDAPVVPPDHVGDRFVRGLLERSGRWRHGRYVDAVARRALR